jgi:hypothetical protein
MSTSTNTAKPHRQLLVRCDVENRLGEDSVRFVEHSLYRLWQYMMANKHQLRVQQASLCLWLPESEWDAQAKLFEHAGQVEAVHRIAIALFDDEQGFCNTIQRFVPEQDSQRVRTLLLSRLPANARETGDFVMEIEAGHAVARGATDLGELGTPLAVPTSR